MGFNIISAVYVFIILVPNLFFFIFRPTDVPALKKDPLALVIFENAGRIACFVLPFVFGEQVFKSQFDFIFAAMLLCAAFYYACWIRYFSGKRRFKLLFKPLLFIPIPMAVFPFMYFLLMAVWLKSIPMGIAVFVFGIGHIPISWITYKQIKNQGAWSDMQKGV